MVAAAARHCHRSGAGQQGGIQLAVHRRRRRALFTTNFAPVAALDAVVNDGLIAAIADNAGIFLFLVLLGIIVALVNAAGGSAAFGRWAETHIKTHAGAQFATFILGVLIFIDDYFNCLTVGSVMRPVTDGHKFPARSLPI